MTPELIILLGFIVILAMVAALAGTFIGLRLARKAMAPKPFKDKPAPAPAPAPPPEPKPEPEKESSPPPRPESAPLRAYQAILEAKGVAAKERDAQTRDFAKMFEDLRERLDGLACEESAVQSALDDARKAMREGEFSRAIGLLNQAGERGASHGLDLARTVKNLLGAAATARAIAGDLEMAQMNFPEAARCYHSAIESLPPEDGEMMAEYLNKLGTAFYQAGNLAEAAKSFERAAATLERNLGARHPDVATALNNLALLHYAQGNLDAAEPLYKRALAIDEHALGPDHPGVATDLNNLALLLKKKGDARAAEPLLRRALAIKEKVFDPGHPSLATGLRNYASVLKALGRVAEAKTYESRAAALPPSRMPQPESGTKGGN